MATGKPGLPEVRLLPAHHLHRQALALLHQAQVRRPTRDGKLVAMESDWIVDHGPYSEFGDLLTAARRPVHRRRLRHPQHPRPRPDRLHQPRLGLGLPRLRLAAELPRLREPDGRAGREDGHGPAGAALPERLPPGRHHARPARRPRSISFPEMIDKLRPLYQAALKKAKARVHAGEEEGRRHLASASTAAAWTAPTRSEVGVELTPDGVTCLHHLGRPRPGRRHGHPGHRPTRRCGRWASRRTRSSW